MGITSRTRKLLWGRSGDCCAICRRPLSERSATTGRRVVVGEECHIVSRKPDGPRGSCPLPPDCDGYDNLILLCPIDHKIIDELEAEYPPEDLRRIKRAHEEWAEARLGLDPDGDVGRYAPKLSGFEWQKKNRVELIGRFAPELSDHPPDVTDLQDYYTFVEEQSLLSAGSGEIISANHKEILSIWSRLGVYSIYEAFLLRHLREGGTLRRIFVAGPEYVDSATTLLFLAVLYRHNLLQFKPLVASVLDLRKLEERLGLQCDMFGVGSQKVAFFIQFPDDSYPIFLRTMDPALINRAVDAYSDLESNAEPAERWMKRQPIGLDLSWKKRIERECQLIHSIAETGHGHV